MAPTPGSTSSTSKPAKPARSEPQASEAREDLPAKPARSEPQASEGHPVGSPARPGLVPVGRIASGHGVRGQVRLRLFTEPETLARVTRLTLAGERPDAPDDVFEVLSSAPGRRGELRLTLGGVGSRDAAEALRGRIALAAVSELAPLPEGEVYGFELVGCRLEGEDGRVVGRVREIWETGAPDVLIVEGEDGREHLIPAALLREVDPAAGRAVAEILPGLLDPTPGAPHDADREEDA
jgi:16S rRNA processing protein RimM